MKLEHHRFAFTPEDTQGVLCADGWSCFTIEQPWRRWNYPGGKPFESCIPDGTYKLIPFRRSNGDQAFAMVNPDLGVYFRADDRPVDDQGKRLGRYKCLIHGRANYAHDVQGCAAVGDRRQIDPDKNIQMVTNSTITMETLIEIIGWIDGHTVEITATAGAIDTPLITKEAI